jgi:hypothetical protein
MKAGPKPRGKGMAKQFGGGGGKAPFGATQKQATAAMQGKAPQSESTHKSIARKDAKKNTVRAGGKNVF